MRAVDLADFISVTSFAERFHRECDCLVILVMNAGILTRGYEETVNGWESRSVFFRERRASAERGRSLQVNHLGMALLSLLLLLRLVDTGRKFGSASRFVIVPSDVHYWAVPPGDVKESSNPVTRFSGPNYRDLLQALFYSPGEMAAN